MKSTDGEVGLEHMTRHLIIGAWMKSIKDENGLCQICRLVGQAKKWKSDPT